MVLTVVKAKLIGDAGVMFLFLFQLFLSKYGWTERSSGGMASSSDVLVPSIDDKPPAELRDLPSMKEAASMPRPRGKPLAVLGGDPGLMKAIAKFQSFSQLPVTGQLDEATLAAMNQPRCGMPDRQPMRKATSLTLASGPGLAQRHSVLLSNPPRGGSASPSAKVRKKRFLQRLSRQEQEPGSPRAPGRRAFSRKLLRWRLVGEGYSSQLSDEEQRFIFRLAFRMWSEVTPLTFKEDRFSPAALIDIKLGFGRGESGSR